MLQTTLSDKIYVALSVFFLQCHKVPDCWLKADAMVLVWNSEVNIFDVAYKLKMAVNFNAA